MGIRTGLIATAKINRHDFGLGRGVAVRFAASEVATIEIDLDQTSARVREAVVTVE